MTKSGRNSVRTQPIRWHEYFMRKEYQYKSKLGPFVQGPAQLTGFMPVCVGTLPGGAASLRIDHIPERMIEWAEHPPLLHAVKQEYQKFSGVCQQCFRTKNEEGGTEGDLNHPCPRCGLMIHDICAVVCIRCQEALCNSCWHRHKCTNMQH